MSACSEHKKFAGCQVMDVTSFNSYQRVSLKTCCVLFWFQELEARLKAEVVCRNSYDLSCLGFVQHYVHFLVAISCFVSKIDQ